MASNGSGNRSKGGTGSSTGNRSGSGSRKPQSARTAATGETATRSSAADRARDRAQQGPGRSGGRGQGGGGGRGQGGGRPGGGGSRRQPNRKQGMSTAAKSGIFGTIVVVLAVLVIVLVSVFAGSSSPGKADNHYITPHADAAITNAVTHVPVSELEKAGDGASLGTVPSTPPSSVGLLGLTGKPLTQNGKPLVVYLGSEFCPYCAATRWPFIIALSRFGTFKGLEVTASSPLDVFASTPTLTFAKATYSSPYFTLSTTEELSNHCPASDVIPNSEYSQIPASDYPPKYSCNNEDYLPIKAPSKQVQSLATSIDTDGNFGSGNGGGIPFIDFGGKYAEDGALYQPSVLHGLTWAEVVHSFSVPTEGVGQAILSVANRYTAVLCEMTGNKPASVCHTKLIENAEKALTSS